MKNPGFGGRTWGAGAVLALLVLTGFQAAVDKGAKDVIQVEVTGTIRTGLMAIGAETTGTVIEAGGVAWELDFGGNPALQTQAKGLNGKRATVTGTYRRKAGVEIPRREIVTVTTLRPAESAP